MLQKTFHMSQSLEACKARLANIHSYRRQLGMVTKATVTSSKTVDFGFRGPLGFNAETVLSSLPSASDEQLAFESHGGNFEVVGLVEFTPIRHDCTEVSVVLDYQIESKFFAWLDRRFAFVDAFLNSELGAIRAHFEGSRAIVQESAPRLAGLTPARA